MNLPKLLQENADKPLFGEDLNIADLLLSWTNRDDDNPVEECHVK